MPGTLAFPNRASRDTGRRWLLGALSVLLCAGYLLFLSPSADSPVYWPIIGVGAAVSSLCVVGSLRMFGFAWHSAPFIYIAFLWMFHFPLTLFLQLDPGLWEQLSGPVYSWTQSASWYRASLYALLCVIAFALGCGLAPRPRRSSPRAMAPGMLRFQVGIATALGGLAWLYYLMFREVGLELFANSYAQLYTTLFGGAFSTAIFIVSAGSFLALTSAPRKLTWIPVAIQLAGSVPVLLTGSRQFALVGPLVLAALAVRRGLRLGLVSSAVSCVLVLWMISYVGESRAHGVAEGVAEAHQVSPVRALVEMGSSLETASLAVDWIQNGDSFLWGGSYWLPFERALGLIVPLRQDLETDKRAMHMVMVSRVAGLGGSAVAESYYNFSLFGTIFFFALGAVLGRLDIGAHSSLSSAFLGVLLYAFTMQARNWFISVPQTLLVGCLPIALCILAEAVMRRRTQNLDGRFAPPFAPPPIQEICTTGDRV